MFEIFLNNFIRFDFLIFLLALCSFAIIIRTRRLVKEVLKILKPEGYLPGGKIDSKKIQEHYDFYLNPEGEKILQEKHRKSNFSYTLFVNLTSVFPLMGILGTVISLLPMVRQLGDLSAQTGLFFSALTSTFWGIVFAILFKAFNGFLEAELDYCNKLTDLYVERNTFFFGTQLKGNTNKKAMFINEEQQKRLENFSLEYPNLKKDKENKENTDNLRHE